MRIGGEADITLVANDLYLRGLETRLVTQFGGVIVTDLEELNACTWEHCYEAELNIVDKPERVGPYDPHLTEISPCIDAGVDPHAWYDGAAVEIDYDGDPRPLGDGWDIGADEFTALLSVF